jgi:Glycosyl transferase family 2
MSSNCNSLPQGPQDKASDRERFRRSYLFALPAGDDQALIVRDQACGVLVSVSDLELLNRCTRFATLEAHADTLTSGLGTPAVEAHKLVRRLEELAMRGLLDRASLVARGGGTRAHVPQTIRTVIIPTRGRPDTVARAVRSVAQAAKHASRRIDCLVIDDNDDDKDVSRLPPIDGIQVTVIGRRERQRIAEILASESRTPLEVARHAVLGNPVGWQPGAARNTALLLAAGQVFLSIDDDVLLRLAASPVLRPGARATSVHDPTEFWFFRDRAAALAVHHVDIDPFKAIECSLGRPAGALLDGDPNALWLDDITPSLAAALGGGRARVAVTSFGVVGDSGMGNVRHYLHLRGDSLRRATSDDATWAWVRTTRTMLRATESVVLSGGSHLMAMAIGLDNTRFLPAFPPSGRNQDQRFCQFLHHCSDDALVAHLPWAIYHDPPEARISSEPQPGLFGLLEPVGWVVQLQSISFGIPPEDRLRALGAALEEHGRLPLSVFEQFVRLCFLKRCSDEISGLEAQLESAPTPAFAADVRRDIAVLRARLLDDAIPLPIELSDRPANEALAAMQGYLLRLGEVLRAWPALVAAARQLPLLPMIVRQ